MSPLYAVDDGGTAGIRTARRALLAGLSAKNAPRHRYTGAWKSRCALPRMRRFAAAGTRVNNRGRGSGPFGATLPKRVERIAKHESFELSRFESFNRTVANGRGESSARDFQLTFGSRPARLIGRVQWVGATRSATTRTENANCMAPAGQPGRGLHERGRQQRNGEYNRIYGTPHPSSGCRSCLPCDR